MTAEALAPAAVAPEDRAVEDLAGRLDAARSAVEALDPARRRVATDLQRASDDLHRAALVHVVRTLREDPRGKELLFALVDDPVVHTVLLAHGIVRPDPATLAGRVLEGVRPQLRSHGGDVELVRVEGGTAFVRLSGACNGCSMAATTMRDGVERALLDGVPGLGSVEVVPSEPGPTLIPLSAVGVRPGAAETGWVRACGLGEVPGSGLLPVSLVPDDAEPLEALVVVVDGRMSAYVNSCAHLGRRLDDALVDPVEGTITCAGHGFCYDILSGECLSMPGAQLEQLPLRVDGEHVWVRAVR